MLMLRSTHERLMAEQRAAVAAALQHADDWAKLSSGLLTTIGELTRRVADFADRTVPPKRAETVKQPLSIDAADGAVVKKLKGIK